MYQYRSIIFTCTAYVFGANNDQSALDSSDFDSYIDSCVSVGDFESIGSVYIKHVSYADFKSIVTSWGMVKYVTRPNRIELYLDSEVPL